MRTTADAEKSKKIRLAEGDLVPVEGASRARWLFLQAVERCVPEALEKLGELVWVPGLGLEPTSPDQRRAEEASLRGWAEEYGFTDRWLLRTARRTIDWWREWPAHAGRTWAGFTPNERQRNFPAGPSWNPREEKEESFRARVESYITDLRATPGMRTHPVKQGDVHFEWLALHQVRGLTEDKIAERYQDLDGKPGVSAVSRAITETAALAGLTLRPGRGRRTLSQP